MTDKPPELVRSEFCRETVERIARGITQGWMRFDWEEKTDLHTTWGHLCKQVSVWLSQGEMDPERGALESLIVENYILLQGAGLLKEAYSQTKVEDDIKNLNARLDSNNNLLLKALKAFTKTQEDVEFIRKVLENLGGQ